MIAKLILLPLLATLSLASPVHVQRDAQAGKRIRSLASPNLCVTVQNGYAAYGTRVALTACSQGSNGDGYLDEFQYWSVTGPQRGQIKLSSKDYMCLDAGDESNGAGITIEACEDGKDSQIWTVGTTGTGSQPNLQLSVGSAESQCLDVVKDSTPVQSKPYGSEKDAQVWSCHTQDGNTADAIQQFFELATADE
ncbi:uncharacterized protein I303_100374 [Kwoniella dejecticola CBS 10117]|uniref:Ricin B lectin domain-containing protein n=1 Tax=Kwoniella dejecticola CBS 10117 TaxID=1296121 RepID=A0A1A6AEQ6_9TREE|nr:uncharacterized protein I303_00374 [Kwoniella dejecticola CBS 10117]OBR88557.1 hypothetical protein I303_00374 [Kwoniella dejecticola CBS 10117]